MMSVTGGTIGEYMTVVDSRGRGIHQVQLRPCLLALRRRQMEDHEGRFDTLGGLAAQANVSRSSMHRFWAGGRLSFVLTRRILRALSLEFEDVVEKGDAVPVL